MDSALEIRFKGWTATPRMPFVLSGNALCLPVPTYSSLLGLIGCCLGRVVEAGEVQIGFKYKFEGVARDLETRQRLEFDGKKIRQHKKGSDAYAREFHVQPQLTIWINRIDWKNYFENPTGTPSLGRSQDILRIESVRQVQIVRVDEAELSGCMLPFTPDLRIGGQLIQLAESFRENDRVGSGRSVLKTSIFMAVHFDNPGTVQIPNLFRTVEDDHECFYLHNFDA